MAQKQQAYIGIKVKNESSGTVLELHFTDYIYDGFDWNTWETINLVQDTIDKIKAANPDIIKIIINSLGGDVMIGLALYNYLKAHPAEKHVDIIGFAASIASVMAMCASPGKLRMAKSSFMIIHAAWSCACGNAAQIRTEAETLDKVTNELASIYALRSGKDASYFTEAWADGDHWLTATEAKEVGLVDEIYNSETVNASARVNLSDYPFKNIPASLMKNEAAPSDQKSFLSNLNNTLMGFLDKLKAAITGAKEDPAIKKVEGGDAFIAALEKHFEPVATALDEAAKPKAEVEETTTATEEKPAEEKKKEEEKKAEEKKEDQPAENAELQAANDKIAALEDKVKRLSDDLAASIGKPAASGSGSGSSKASKARIEYGEEV